MNINEIEQFTREPVDGYGDLKFHQCDLDILHMYQGSPIRSIDSNVTSLINKKKNAVISSSQVIDMRSIRRKQKLAKKAKRNNRKKWDNNLLDFKNVTIDLYNDPDDEYKITGAIYRSEVYLYDIFGNEIGNLFFTNTSSNFISLNDADIKRNAEQINNLFGMQKMEAPTGQIFKLKLYD